MEKGYCGHGDGKARGKPGCNECEHVGNMSAERTSSHRQQDPHLYKSTYVLSFQRSWESKI